MVFVFFVNILHFFFNAILIGEFEIAVDESFHGGRYEMLMHQSLSELLLIVSKLILIEIEFLVSGDIGWY